MMDEKYRRPAVVIVSTTVGVLAVLMNQPLVIVLIATLATGGIVMVVTGGIRIQLRKRGSKTPEEEKTGNGKSDKKSRKERKQEKKASKAAIKGEKEKKSFAILSKLRRKPSGGPGEETAAGTGAPEDGRRSALGYLASFGAAMKSLAMTGLRSRRSGEGGEIDHTLDRVIADADDGDAEKHPPEKEDERKGDGDPDDPLAELDDIPLDQLDPDQEVIEYPIPGGGAGAPPSEEMLPLSEVSRMLDKASRTAHIIQDPAGKNAAVSDILAAHADELKEDHELPDLDIQETSPDDLTLDSLDDIDVAEEIVIEGDGSTEPDGTAGEAAVQELTYEEYEEESDSGSDEDAGSDTRNLVSFATGETEDSMIKLLKEEVGVKKKKVDVSLIRELKGTRISAEELKTELEELLGQMSHGGA